jgi:putative transposase
VRKRRRAAARPPDQRCTRTTSSALHPRPARHPLGHDTTERATAQGKLCGCAVKDLFSDRIFGYALDDRMTAPLDVTLVHCASQAAADRSHPGTLCCRRTSWTPPLAHPGRAPRAEQVPNKHTYDSRRRQRALGKLTPIKFEVAFTRQAAAVPA